jgi:hypothetical protein
MRFERAAGPRHSLRSNNEPVTSRAHTEAEPSPNLRIKSADQRSKRRFIVVLRPVHRIAQLLA